MPAQERQTGKPAFEDDEEWFNRGEIVLREDATDYIPITMTGQEWYDRFEKELSQAPAKFNQLMEGTVAVKEVRMAAKRASGIGDEK